MMKKKLEFDEKKLEKEVLEVVARVLAVRPNFTELEKAKLLYYRYLHLIQFCQSSANGLYEIWSKIEDQERKLGEE